MSKIIGIDLGTTNSVVAFMDRNDSEVIINEEGSRVTPSVVAIAETGERLVGNSAKRQLVLNAETTVHSVKRFIGRKFDDAKEDVPLVNYKISEASNGDCAISIRDREYSPQEISAMILQNLKRSAEAFLGEPVTEAVITVPAYFTDRQRQATRDAGVIAGLKVLRIINEPTAAALAYLKSSEKNNTVAVYDFGGGTFDISILDIEGDVAQVKATRGNTALGGADLDSALVEWLLEQFMNQHGIDVSEDKVVRQRLRDAAERAKIELSSTQATEINLPFLISDTTGPKHLQCALSRSDFEDLIGHLIEDTIAECEAAVSDSGLSYDQIDEVILVGGSSRIPMAQKLVGELFGQKLNRSFNPDEVVALGASIQGGILEGDVKSITLLDVTNFSLGIESEGRRFSRLIKKGTHIPTQKSQLVSTVTDNQTSVRIHVLQGEDDLAKNNISLGDFELVGIPPAPRGTPKIQVRFSIDSNGIVNVSAKDTASGREQAITISAPTSHTAEEIEQLKNEAKKYEHNAKDEQLILEQVEEVKRRISNAKRQMIESAEKIGSVAVGNADIALNDFERNASKCKTAAEIAAVSNSLEQWLSEQAF